MSSDLFWYKNPDSDDSISVEMRASGLMELMIFNERNDNLEKLNFAPNDEGKTAAKNLAAALLEWVKHVELVKLDELWDEPPPSEERVK